MRRLNEYGDLVPGDPASSGSGTGGAYSSAKVLALGIIAVVVLLLIFIAYLPPRGNPPLPPTHAAASDIQTQTLPQVLIDSATICRGDFDQPQGSCREDQNSPQLTVVCRYRGATVGQTAIQAAWYLDGTLLGTSSAYQVQTSDGFFYHPWNSELRPGVYRAVILSNDVTVGTAEFTVADITSQAQGASSSSQKLPDLNTSTGDQSAVSPDYLTVGQLSTCSFVSGWRQCASKEMFYPGERVFIYADTSERSTPSSSKVWFAVSIWSPHGEVVYNSRLSPIYSPQGASWFDWAVYELPPLAAAGHYRFQVRFEDGNSQPVHVGGFDVVRQVAPGQLGANLNRRVTPQTQIFEVRHKHTFGSCQGQMELSVDLIFRSYTNTSHSFRYAKAEIVGIDNDGIVDRNKKKWHFGIPGMTASQVHELLANWLYY